MQFESIKEFYDNAEVFVTGASGFIGKVLVEKLLRSCTGIEKVYILVRAKKGRSPADRIKAMTQVMLFDQLRKENPDAIEKIHAIEGDAMQLNLGISDADREKLKLCSVVFHAAASVRFDDPLQSAILLNTRGTHELCKLALTMTNLKALVHVSTAYIQPKNYYVEEKIYPAEGDWKTYIKLAEFLDENLLNEMTPK
jgi:alcohol-forming fatty acyl-CoA reductase